MRAKEACWAENTKEVITGILRHRQEGRWLDTTDTARDPTGGVAPLYRCDRCHQSGHRARQGRGEEGSAPGDVRHMQTPARSKGVPPGA